MSLQGILLLAVLATSASARHLYIVGGGTADMGAWKYQISLRIYGRHTCGGSIISTNWVLCAAHCVGYPVAGYSVVVGMHDQNRTLGQPVEHKVEMYIVHPDYDEGTGNYPNDVSLIRLKTHVDLSNSYVELATMAPDDGHKYDGDLCYISGWGLMIDGGDVAPVLQEAHVDVLSQSDCKDYWDSQITPGHVCIFDKAKQKVCACNGDSGGPLSCWRHNMWYVVGIASWVADGCLPTYPGVYTRVSEYRQWIDAAIGSTT